jgi:predicted nuclease of predicted toxin-antitoxin system
MKLLLDQDVYGLTAKFLVSAGHDVLRVSDIGLAQATDEALLNEAASLGRLFVTRDRDYGNLVFVKSIKIGVVYIRILPSSLKAVHAELERVLSNYTEAELKKAFVVVEAGGHRFRHI